MRAVTFGSRDGQTPLSLQHDSCVKLQFKPPSLHYYLWNSSSEKMYKKLHFILQFSYLRGPSNHHCGSLMFVKFQICALFYISFIRLENKIPQNSSVILCHTSSRFQWLYGYTTDFPWYSTWGTEEIIICRDAFLSLQIQVKLTT